MTLPTISPPFLKCSDRYFFKEKRKERKKRLFMANYVFGGVSVGLCLVYIIYNLIYFNYPGGSNAVGSMVCKRCVVCTVPYKGLLWTGFIPL